MTMFPLNRNNVFSCPELGYRDPHASTSSSANVCMIVAVVVIIALLAAKPSESRDGLYSMVATTTEAVSAKLAVATQRRPGLKPAYRVYAAIQHQPIQIAQPKLPEKMSEDDKKQCAQAVDDWLQKNPKAVVLVFAQWCGHCHNMMRPFSDALKSFGVAGLMINYECMPKVMLGAMYNSPKIEYFPTLFTWDKTQPVGSQFTRFDSPDDAAKTTVGQGASAKVALSFEENDQESALNAYATELTTRKGGWHAMPVHFAPSEALLKQDNEA